MHKLRAFERGARRMSIFVTIITCADPQKADINIKPS